MLICPLETSLSCIWIRTFNLNYDDEYPQTGQGDMYTATKISVVHFTNKVELSLHNNTHRKISCIGRTKSQNLNVSHIVLQLSLPNPLKPGVKSNMKL